jgi:biopolymer transport protein ExbD
MAGKRKRSEEQAQVPMSSMIDVVFLLLIYFIVTQKDEVSEAHLAVNLPTPNVAEKRDEPPARPIEIAVFADRIQIQGRTMTPERIVELLEPRAKEDPDLTVMVKTSTKARTKNLVTVLDLCQSIGLTKLNVVTLDD